MKASCHQENLARGLAIVGRVISARTTLPVLSNVLLATDAGRLKLSATNLEIGITCWIGARVEEDGAITVPARLLGDFVNSLPADRVDLLVDPAARSLTLRCQRIQATVKGIDPEEFPPIPEPEDRPTAVLEAGLLRQMIEQVAFAAAADESRPVWAGVNVTFKEREITMAAADGYRLAVRTAELEESLPPEVGGLNIIVPAKALQELARIIGDDAKEPVEMTVTPNKSQVLFRCGSVTLVSRLIEGQFPNYMQVVPKSYVTRVVVKTAQLSQAVRIASLFARESANVVKLQVVPSGQELTPGHIAVSANAAEVGENVSELDALVEGEEIQVAYSARFLTEVLNVLKTEEVALEITGQTSPSVIRPVDGIDYLYVIMPMHSVA